MVHCEVISSGSLCSKRDFTILVQVFQQAAAAALHTTKSDRHSATLPFGAQLALKDTSCLSQVTSAEVLADSQLGDECTSTIT